MFKKVRFGIFIGLLLACVLSPGAKTPPPFRRAPLAPAADAAATKRKIADILKLITGSRETLEMQDIRVAQIEPGQSATGVVLFEDEEQLVLDTNYCEDNPYKKQNVTFLKPYDKSNPEEVRCPTSGAHVRVKVKQR
jgi:hypothetical protein